MPMCLCAENVICSLFTRSEHGFTALPTLLHPKSIGAGGRRTSRTLCSRVLIRDPALVWTGYIGLRSADPFDAPVIQPNYLGACSCPDLPCP